MARDENQYLQLLKRHTGTHPAWLGAGEIRVAAVSKCIGRGWEQHFSDCYLWGGTSSSRSCIRLTLLWLI